MTKYPLFGQDSVPQYTSRILGLIGTGIFWVLFVVLMIVIKPIDKKPKYKEVQIVLSSTPKTVTQPEPVAAPEPAPSAAPSTEAVPAETQPVAQPVVQETPAVVEKPVAPKEPQKVKAEPKATEKPVQKAEPPKAEPKPVAEQPVKTESKPAPKKAEPVKQPEPTFTGKDVDPMDAYNAQIQKVQKKAFDWNRFDDSAVTSESTQTANNVKPQPVDSSFEGSAGTTAAVEEKKVTSTSANTNNNKKGTTAGTNAALDDIANTKGTVNAAVQGNAADSKATVANADNGLKWTSGAARKMLMPKSPKLDISNENQSKVNATEVNITFTVNKDGYVVRNSVTTNPPIAQSVLDEIQNQIADWWFDSGDESATATLIWKIQRN